MKSAYELVMERLGKGAPVQKLTDTQRKELAELDAVYAAKLAERDLHLTGQAAHARAAGEEEAAAKLADQLVGERRALQAELERKKEEVRQRPAGG